MSNTKHTPGPWILIPSGRDMVISTFNKDRVMAFLTLPLAEEDFTEQAANGQLIAAAPEMLEALEKALPELLESLKECGHDPAVGIDASALIDAIESCEAAIKKAKEGQQ